VESETNPDIVYIGMGETCIRDNIMPAHAPRGPEPEGHARRFSDWPSASHAGSPRASQGPETTPELLWPLNDTATVGGDVL
jgi:hypothetical protein